MEQDHETGLTGLSKTIKNQGVNGNPPVHLWNPPYCGEIGLRIAVDGTWYYLNSPIGRKPLVKLFASVLRKEEDGQHYLVTPVEKIGIEVEDSPFLAIEMFVDNQGRDQVLSFRTNVDDYVKIGRDHPIRFELDHQSEAYVPYITVRGALEARVTRSLYYDLVELAQIEQIEDDDYLGIWSLGEFFPIARRELTGFG